MPATAALMVISRITAFSGPKETPQLPDFHLPIRFSPADWKCTKVGKSECRLSPPCVVQGSVWNRREIVRSITRFPALQPSPELRDFVAAMPPNRNDVRHRRRSPRTRLVADVTVIPLDTEFCPIGPPFIACTKNASIGGIVSTT